MIKISPYVEYLLEDAFSELELVDVARMFGGYAFYLDGRIFGFTIEGDQLVMKADDESKSKFEELGGEQFIYQGHKNKGPVGMPYWSVPEEIIEDKVVLAEWARQSALLSKPKVLKR